MNSILSLESSHPYALRRALRALLSTTLPFGMVALLFWLERGFLFGIALLDPFFITLSLYLFNPNPKREDSLL